MSIYFFQLRDGTDEVLDPEGSEFENIREIEAALFNNVRDVMAQCVREGLIDLRSRIDAENGEGVIIRSLRFEDAVLIRHASVS
jgi:hypothetical protein